MRLGRVVVVKRRPLPYSGEKCLALGQLLLLLFPFSPVLLFCSVPILYSELIYNSMMTCSYMCNGLQSVLGDTRLVFAHLYLVPTSFALVE